MEQLSLAAGSLRRPSLLWASRSRRQLLIVLLGVAFCGWLALSLIYLFSPLWVQALNLRTTDILARLLPTRENNLVVAVDIDERSLKEYGQWPWPRQRFAKLLEVIQEQGATAIGVTMIFAEPDRNSLTSFSQMLQRDYGFELPLPGALAGLIDPDRDLADTLAGGPFVLAHSFTFDDKTELVEDCLLPHLSLEVQPHLNLYQATAQICNIEPLNLAASAAGFVNGTPDPDGVLRRLPLLLEYRGHIYPSFALATLIRSTNAQNIGLATDPLGAPLLAVEGLMLPIDERGNLLLSAPGYSRTQTISAAHLLGGRLRKGMLAGKIVVVGTTAAGLSQIITTPFEPALSLLSLQQQALTSMLSDQPSRRPSQLLYLEAAATLLLVIPMVLAVGLLAPMASTIFSMATLAVVWTGSLLCHQITGYLLSPLLPSITVLFQLLLLHSLRYRHYQVSASNEASTAFSLLRNQEDRLRSILETIPDIVFRLDRNSKITYISPAIGKYLKNPDELLGREIFELVIPEDLEKARFRLNERRTGKRATTDLEVQLRLTLNDDTTATSRFFSVSAEGIYADNLPSRQAFLGTQGIVRDITERKVLEKRLIQAQKMEVVGNLAAGIAHDLNNILSGLVSYPELLMLELADDDPLKKKVAIIQKSGQKAAVIVQDLLSLARRNIEIIESCNLNTIVRDYFASAEYQRLQGRYPRIAVNISLQSDLKNCTGSAVHLSKVLMNGLHNALEAMPAGGEVWVTTESVELAEEYRGFEPIAPGEYTVLRIRDNGVGIAKSEVARIFEPFYTKKALDRSGTGLGMTVIWTTVKDHSGYLDLLSAEGQGTTLSIFLPATSNTLENGQRRVVLDDYVGSEVILIVDDDEDQRTITATILNKLGYQTFLAKSGEEALELASEQQIDLAVLDMIMPGGMDGLDCFREMRRILPDLKAVVVSGFSETERVREMLALGAGAFIQKPYSMEKLGIAIRRELDQPDPQSTGP